MNVDLRHGDCVELMKAMPDCSVDSIVTDPPYGLEFMGKDWDAPWKASGKVERADEGTDRSHPFRDGAPRIEYGIGGAASLGYQDWFTVVATEALRVLKPGGHLLAFGGTRTYHRMACAIEDAGFEIRDSIHWVYATGFPKSLNIGKAIDKAAGAEREATGPTVRGAQQESTGRYGAWGEGITPTAPATKDAAMWEGWGTALKPAHEPIVVARKPLESTVAGNVLVWGTGGLNIDGCRVPSGDTIPRVTGAGTLGGSSDGWDRPWKSDPDALARRQDRADAAIEKANTLGRWPANVVFDRTAGEALDQQSGERPSAGEYTNSLSKPERDWAPFGGMAKTGKAKRSNAYANDTGGASRFFTQADFGPDDWPFVYQAKPSRRERNAGLDGLPEGRKAQLAGADKDGPLDDVSDRFRTKPAANVHPTVKPVALMRHLVRLVTPPGGTVLDPFAGSGTTLVAAVLEGFDAIGCEMTDEYLPIIEGRVAWAQAEVQARAANPEQPTLL